MTLAVPLEGIPGAFEGIVPSAICTVGPDGMPNATYLSIVHQVDSEHIALSRQFFNKTERNTGVNPRAQVIVVDPYGGGMFQLDLVYERTETEGTLFERVRTKLDAVAAQDGMANVFRLRGIDVCRVEECVAIPSESSEAIPQRHVNLQKVEEVSRLVSTADDMDALIGVTLDACRDLLDCHHAFVMLVDESGERLYTVASAGYPSSGTGSEVRIGDGIIGVAAASRQSVRVTNMARELSYTHAARAPGEPGKTAIEQVIPLPGLTHAQSQLVTPMLAYHGLVGVICLQSEAVGAFSAADECIAGILASQVAMAMARLKDVEAQPEPQAMPEPVNAEPRRAQVKHYQEDDSVFLDNEYLIKGVAGGILWRLLRVFEEEGRTEFSNKEIRLDQTLELPDIKDNLEARLILLRKRLEERSEYLRIEKTARGRFRLVVTRPLALTSIEGGGPL